MASTRASHRPALALTMGDPAGVGPDITLSAWLQRRTEALPPFFLVADPDMMAARAAGLGLDVAVEVLRDPCEAPKLFPIALPVHPIRLAAEVRAGAPDPRAGPHVIAAIEAAVALVRSGKAAAVVTNPIGKRNLYEAGFRHPGHTEFLAELAAAWGRRPHAVMMLACEALRVVPVTVHIPLKEVAARLTADLVERTVEITAEALRTDFGIARPRIAVAALNPHAGEGGALGREEIEVIGPAVERLRARGIRVMGPLPADALFAGRFRPDYDAAVAMYHDQALIPIKTLAFERAVNVTLGLPFVRTSPDHGTAYSLAGSGRADPSSLIEALKLAAAIAARRSAGA